MTLYQTGILRRLPDPPIGPFDSERVNASDYAYKRLQVPDAVLMMGTYAATAGLAAAGGQHRAEQSSLLPLAMAAKTAFDVATNLTLASEEWAANKALRVLPNRIAALDGIAPAGLAESITRPPCTAPLTAASAQPAHPPPRRRPDHASPATPAIPPRRHGRTQSS